MGKQKILRSFSLFLDSFLEKEINPRLFIKLFNLRNRCTILRFNRGAKDFVRISMDTKSNMFTVIGSSYSIICSDLKNINHTYKAGLDNRALEIGNTYLLNHVPLKDGDLIVDCGANVGDLFLYFKAMNLTIDYIGFEPSPMEFECLRTNIPIEHNVYNLGLWNSTGILKFFRMHDSSDNSFIPSGAFKDSVNIQTVRLDNFVNRRIKLFKVEAEGGEPEVLYGAENMLNKIEYISVDAGPERGINNEMTLVPVLNYMLTNNFELVKLSLNRVVLLFKNRSFN